LLLSACGAQRPTLAPPDRSELATTTTATTTTTSPGSTATAGQPTTGLKGKTTPTSAPGSTAPLVAAAPNPSNLRGFIATPVGVPNVFVTPSIRSARIAIPKLNNLGVANIFAVIGSEEGPWLEVLLPTRPNGRTAWMPRSSVRVTTTDLRVFVDLGGRRLTAKRGTQTLLQVPIAIGTPDNPTPTGSTYITELLDTGRPGGAYGPFAYGLALHSNTLSEFAGGDGQVGIHGTDAPALIGQRVSHGCVRLANENVRKLVALKLPLGTPVFIT
jgi:lipoprotein-anchoring transpeptidase ErfK/SrfK